MILRKLDQLMRKGRERKHLHQCRALLSSPPIQPRDDGVIIFSMIGTAVLLPYLLAVKSLHHQIKRGRIAILSDGTLTAQDRDILNAHLGNPEIFEISEVGSDPCPKGGCWERLLTLLKLRDDHYVIQLDSDAVTIGAVPEIVEAIEANRSFSLAGGEIEAPLGFLPIDEFLAQFYPAGEESSGHIQSVFESQLAKLPGTEPRRYGRACAGFAGFSKGGGGLQAAINFSQEAQALTGDRWSEWGTEQITSNYLIASEQSSTMLPYGRYFNYWNAPWGRDMRFIHFVGAWRYANSSYAQASAQAIEILASSSR